MAAPVPEIMDTSVYVYFNTSLTSYKLLSGIGEDMRKYSKKGQAYDIINFTGICIP
jgi:hypothetical protein